MESDVHDIVHQTLQDYSEQDRVVVLESLKTWYGGYRFSSNDACPSMFNPQLVFSYLQSVVNNGNITEFGAEDDTMQSTIVLAVVKGRRSVTQEDFF